MDLTKYLEKKWDSYFLKLRIIPNSKNTEIFWLMENGILKVKIKSVPEKWKANKELIDLIAKTLKIKKTSIDLVSWLTDKNKLLKIDF